MRPVGRVLRRWRTMIEESERGVALPTTMLLLIVMLGAAGFAIDVGHWYLTANQAQQAADAGALAGVTKLPDDETGAENTAVEAAGANGFSSTDIAVEPGNRANQMRVTVTRTVDNFFAGLFGVDETTVTRTALAEFQSPLVMDSPNNWLGNSADISTPQPDFWLMTSGRDARYIDGDRFQAANGSSEWDPDGYRYRITVKSVPTSGDLNIEVFDPINTDSGSRPRCTNLPSNAQNQELVNDHPALYGINGQYTAPGEDATFRYAAGRWEPNGVTGGVVTDPSDFPYCTADWSNVAVTTFILREPDNTNHNNLDNPIIRTGTCEPRQYKGYSDTSSTNVHQYLDPDDGWKDDQHLEFASAFRQWVTVCTIPNGAVEVGDYILQVRTNSPLGSPEATSGSGGSGANYYSLRAGFGPTGAETLDGSNVAVAAAGRFPIFVGSVGADTEFYLTRLQPSTSGQYLAVSFYDVGDGNYGDGTIQVLPPEEYRNSDGTFGPAGTNVFRDCVWEDTRGSTSGTPGSGNDCTLNNINSTFNGDLVTVYVPIPDNYDCALANSLGCWVKLRFNWASGSDVFDNTVWTAGLTGDPIRLIE